MPIENSEIYTSLLLLKQVVTDTKDDFAGFIQRCKDQFMCIFTTFHIKADIAGITKSKLLDILDTSIDTLSLQIQTQQQDARIQAGYTVKSSVRLARTMGQEQALHRTFRNTVQLIYSRPEYYVDTLHDPEDFIVVPSQVTPLMKQRLGIDVLDLDCRNFKEKLLQFRGLSYETKGTQKRTERIGDIDGIPVTTQIQSKLYNVTLGERIRSEVQPEFSATINSYASVYALMRGQGEVMAGIDNQIDQTDRLLATIKDILVPVFDHMDQVLLMVKNVKDHASLQVLMQEIRNAKSFFLMSSKIWRFKKIAGKNISVDRNLLLGGKHDIGHRRKELLSMADTIGVQFNALESKISLHADALSSMIADLYSLFYVRMQSGQDIPYDEFTAAVAKYLHIAGRPKNELSMEPFSSFLDHFQSVYGDAKIKRTGYKQERKLDTPIATQSDLHFLEMLFLSTSIRFTATTLEHRLKCKDDLPVPSFAQLKDMFHYTEVDGLFADVSGDKDSISSLMDTFFPDFDLQMSQLSQVGDDKEKIYPILQDMQKDGWALPDIV